LVPHEPLRVTTYVREDRSHSLRFLARRGFVEEMREWESRLDVAAFDPAHFDGAHERVRALGIRITTFGALAGDPDRDRKVHALETLLGRDVPSTDAPTEVPFEQWRKMILDNPNLLPDAFIIAVHEPTGDYIGLSTLWRRPRSRHRPYRCSPRLAQTGYRLSNETARPAIRQAVRRTHGPHRERGQQPRNARHQRTPWLRETARVDRPRQKIA
jgi:hypothetical protein